MSIIADNGQRWNVHPSLLSKVAADGPDRKDASIKESLIIEFPQPKPGS